MASQKQIDANRNNAQRSTGPRSATGKAKVALNALKHGLTAVKVVALEEEDPAAFEALRDQLNREWRPGSVLEIVLVDRIAELIWQLRRVAGVEVQVLERPLHCIMPGKQPKSAILEAMKRDLSNTNPTLIRVQMYQSRIDRALHRSLKELRTLQIERQMQDERDVEEEVEDAIPAPLPGERLGEGMRIGDALVTPEDQAEEESVSSSPSVVDAPPSPGSASPHLTSPEGEGPELLSTVERTNPISATTLGLAVASQITPAGGETNVPLPFPTAFGYKQTHAFDRDRPSGH